jgi:hypothetical protein
MVDIVSAMGIPESTLGTIRKEAEKMKASSESAMRMIASMIRSGCRFWRNWKG